jgi:HEAT repeat protein
MVRALVVIAIVLLAVAVLLLIFLAARRVTLAVRERRHAEAEERVRPLAIALVEGEDTTPSELSVDDQAVLAEVLGRYSRKLSGEAKASIAAYFRDGPAFRSALGDLRSRRAWRRAAAAYRLGDMGCDEAAPALLETLEDRSREARAAAARSLGRLGVAEATLPLIEQLVSRRLPHVVAGEALLEVGAGVVPELRRISAHDEPEIRATAVTLLGLVGDSRESPVVEQALHDPSAGVRAAAAVALGRIGSSSAESELRATLDDRAHFVRALAATSLGVIDSRPALPRLVEIARTDRFRPARAAAQAVARIDANQLRTAAAEPGAGPHLHEAADVQAL